MFRIRRDKRGSGRFLVLRVGLFFLAAGVWLAGVRTGRSWVTAAAIAILLPAVLLGFLRKKDES